MVEEKQLLAEKQGDFRKGRGCRYQLMALVLLGQLKAAPGKGAFHQFSSSKVEGG